MDSGSQLGSTNQHRHWNELHQERLPVSANSTASVFAQEVENQLSRQANILELGCGAGSDAAFFAQQGHRVMALDFSEVAVNKVQTAYLSLPALYVDTADISQHLSFNDHIFDAVYARLSLHYFSDQVTRTIFQEISRVLKVDGLLEPVMNF